MATLKLLPHTVYTKIFTSLQPCFPLKYLGPINVAVWHSMGLYLRQGMDLVIRFNKLQSYRCGEKFDVWASRHGDSVTTRYWGIGEDCTLSSSMNHCCFDKHTQCDTLS